MTHTKEAIAKLQNELLEIKSSKDASMEQILAVLDRIAALLGEEETEEEAGEKGPAEAGKLEDQGPINQPHSSVTAQYGPNAVPGDIGMSAVKLDTAVKEVLEEEVALTSENALLIAKRKGLPISSDGTYATKSKSLSFSNSGKRSREDYRPTPSELAEIHKFSNVDMSPDALYSFSVHAADNQPDSQFDIIDPTAHQDGAALAPDSPILLDHTWEINKQIGKTYAADAPGDGLRLKFYILDTPENKQLLDNIFAGVHNKVSIGFNSKLKDIHCSACPDGTSIYSDMCAHEPGMMDARSKSAKPVYSRIKHMARYNETSLVTVPAVHNAGIRRNEPTSKGETMPTQMPTSAPLDSAAPIPPYGLGTPGVTSQPPANATLSAALSAPAEGSSEVVTLAKSAEEIAVQGNTTSVSTIASDHIGEISVADAAKVEQPETTTANQKDMGAAGQNMEVGPGPINTVGESATTMNVEAKTAEDPLKDNNNTMDIAGVVAELRGLCAAIREAMGAAETKARELVLSAVAESAKAAKEASESQLAVLKDAQSKTDERLENLQGIVELAASCTVQQIERDLVARNGSQMAASQKSSIGSILPLIKGKTK